MDYNDPANGMTYKRLPVMAQMAWFRLKYPEGRIAFSGIAEKVTPAGEPVYAVTARVYPDYRLGPECFLAEGTATRGYCREKPSVSPKEWTQTAVIGVALRNAGFGLQFQIAGEEFPEVAPDELGADAMNAPDPAGTTQAPWLVAHTNREAACVPPPERRGNGDFPYLGCDSIIRASAGTVRQKLLLFVLPLL